MSGDGDEVLYAELAGDLRRRSHRALSGFSRKWDPGYIVLPSLIL